MQDFEVMQSFQAADDIKGYSPDDLLSEQGFVFLVLRNLLEQVAIITELHNDAECDYFSYLRIVSLSSRNTSL